MTMTTTYRPLAAVLLGLLAVSFVRCGSSADSPTAPPTPTPAPSPAPALTPATTAIFDGKWSGTTSAGKAVAFRVLSGQLTDFTVDIDFGSGCTYHAQTPSSFDPVDAIYPIGTDAKVTFRFRDPVLRTYVNVEFTAPTKARGNWDATDLLDRVQCPNQTLNPPRTVPAGTFNLTRP
jgi:hypothetical protein